MESATKPSASTQSPAASKSAEWYATWPARLAQLRRAAPDAARGFAALHEATMRDGALTAREKELIALGIAVAIRCENCINAHVKACLARGATAAQIIEVVNVSTVMGGGPAYTYAPLVVEALQALGALESTAS